jgi:hypothetical protein
MNTGRPLIVLIACGAPFAASDCKPGLPCTSAIQATGGNRYVDTLVERKGFVRSDEDPFAVRAPGHEFLIGTEHVLLKQ